MSGKPYIPIYPGDWLRDSVSGCSLAAQGLWLRLMFVAHDAPVRGRIFATVLLDAKRAIARRCGCSDAEFEALFSELLAADVPGIQDGFYVSRRMMRDASISEVRTKAGRKGGKQKASKHPSKTPSKRLAKLKQNSEIEIEYDNEIEIEYESDTDIESDPESGFDKFWSVVPKRVGKRGAEKAYKSAVKILAMRGEPNPDGFLFDRMTLFAASPIGLGDKQFIPHPATWLNNGRYDDDPSAWSIRRDPRGTLDAAQEYLRGATNGNC